MDNNKDISYELTEQQLLTLLQCSVNSINERELFDLCQRITEKHLDSDSEMYKWFHDESVFNNETDS